jgi:hypothetical protein
MKIFRDTPYITCSVCGDKWSRATRIVNGQTVCPDCLSSYLVDRATIADKFQFCEENKSDFTNDVLKDMTQKEKDALVAEWFAKQSFGDKAEFVSCFCHNHRYFKDFMRERLVKEEIDAIEQ